MASDAITGSERARGTAMAHGSRGKGRGVLMAGIALRGSWDMRGGLGLHAGADTVASAAITGSDRALGVGMIHRRWHKIAGVLMASIALRGGRDMRRRLGFNARGHAMARIATAGDRRGNGAVIESGTGKGAESAGMAGITLKCSGGNVIGSFTLRARCYIRTTVARGADRRGRIMVHLRRFEGGRVAMASVTLGRSCWNMSGG